MLQEEELTVGPQDPHDLAQGELGIVDGAQHERRHDRVDRSVGERQPLRRRVDEPARAGRSARRRCSRRARIAAVGFGEDQLVEVVGVVAAG